MSSPSQDAAPQDQPEENASQRHALMAVVSTRRGGVGVAYTDGAECVRAGSLATLNDLDALKMRVHPRLVLVPDKELAARAAQNAAEPDRPYETRAVRRSDFAAAAGRERLAAVLPGDAPAALRLSSWADADDESALRAVSGLLANLHHHAGDAAAQICRAAPLDDPDGVHVDYLTSASLAVFVDDYLGSRRKEGLSLFGLLDRTCTARGRRLLRGWVARPTRRAAELRRRLDAVEELGRPARDGETAELRSALRGLGDAARVASRFEQCSETAADWHAAAAALGSAAAVRAVAARAAPGLPLQREVLEATGGALPALAAAVSATLELRPALAVRAGVLPALDRLREQLRGLDALLAELSRRDGLGALGEAYVYVPQLLFFREVPAGAAAEPDGAGPPAFCAENGHQYYRTARTRELGEALGDPQSHAADLEAAVLRRLAGRVREAVPDLRALGETLARLDALLSLSMAAAEGGWCRPELVDAGRADAGAAVLELRGAWHPLQSQCVPGAFVPNDTAAASGRPLVLSGPNSSGKSVHLKQAGVIAYLAHVGSFVPAASARVGLLDRFVSRMRNAEGACGSLSTFGRDAARVAYALRHAGPRTLLLLDEFGKGTAASDGAALLAAVCRRLARPGGPVTLVATHFALLPSLLGPSSPCRFAHMAAADGAFVYEVRDGPAPHGSGAARCAESAGVPRRPTLERAAQVCECFAEGRPVPPPPAAVARTSGAEGAGEDARLADLYRRFLEFADVPALVSELRAPGRGE